MPCAVYKITSSCKCHSSLVFHRSHAGRIFPLILLLLLFKFHHPYCTLSKCAIHSWMGGEAATQAMEGGLTNIPMSLQTHSPASSPILASSTWKVFVMEDILGQEGSEDCGQEPLWPPAWMFTSKDKKPTTPMCNQPSWTYLHAEFTQYVGLGHKRPLLRLCLTQEPQTTAAIGWWCQQELSQHCAGCALCCSTSKACHSSHIYCCTHPVMKEPLAACPAAPTLHLYPELNSSPNSANAPFHYCCLEGGDSHGLTPWKDCEASASTHSKRQVDLLFLVQCSLCRSGPVMKMLLGRY